jgi:lysozyme
MIPSPSIVAFIKGFEACRLEAYMPTAKDRPTIGWGTTGSDITLGLTWTQVQCDERFETDLAKFALEVTRLITAETAQNHFDAMLSLAYNIGIANYGSSTLLKDHNAGNHAAVPAQFLLWDHQAGQVLEGLRRRREGEAAIYQGTQGV